jgi:hypothetical protein
MACPSQAKYLGGGVGEVPRRRRCHEVKEGETLEDIARASRVSVADLRRFNRAHFPCGEAGLLRAGMRLVVFEAAGDD